MAIQDDIRWFKETFGAEIADAVEGTPISIDLLCAIALQETGYIWRNLRAKGRSNAEILRLCVGDTIDAPGRSAFPQTKAKLLERPRGDDMFALARAALVDMAEATQITSYLKAAQKPDKFCHGYGIFQRDLQFFKKDPDYFLDSDWADFSKCLHEATKELKSGLANLHYENLSTLTDLQSCYLAIVYNTGFGNFDEDRGLKQGFKDDSGKYYGEYMWDYLKKSKGVSVASVAGNSSAVVASIATAFSAPAGKSVVDIAREELETYGGIDEGDQPLRSHIDEYWTAAGADPDDFSPTGDPWSAAFVSYCVRQSGVTGQQFKFSTQHSQFVFAAIQNKLAGKGDFRGYPITEYAPQPGDIIQNNRDGGTYTYADASEHSSYASHSAIVVGFETKAGVKYAVTIGGNETDTVGKKLVALLPDGKIKQRPASSYICVVENRPMRAALEASQVGRFVVKAKPNLNLRSGPSETFMVLKALPFGTAVNVIEIVAGNNGNWALVDLDGDGGRDGFMFASFLAQL